MRDRESESVFFTVRETAFSAAHPSGFGGEGDVLCRDFCRRGDGDEEGDVAFIAITGVNSHEGSFGIRPGDFGSCEAFW